MKKTSQTTLKIVGFGIIVIGGAIVSFGNTNTIRVIGGLMVAVGSALVSLI
jgi:hypothetical protein